MSYDTITLRELVGGVLVEAGKEHKDIYVIDSDLAKSTTTNQFEEVFPERFVETGIGAERHVHCCRYRDRGKDSILCKFRHLRVGNLLDPAASNLLRQFKRKADCHPPGYGRRLRRGHPSRQ